MRRSPRPRRLRPSQRQPPATPAPPPPPPPAKATPADVEKALERRVTLQRALTQEVKRTAAAYGEVRELQGVGAEEYEPRYRNPHDAISDFDRLDRKDPVVLGPSHYLLMIPGFMRRARHVPDKGVAEYAEDEDGEFALINCPCGAKPIARRRVEKCIGCERFYTILDGKRAIVIYGAMTPPGGPEGPLEQDSDCPAGTCDGSGFIVDEVTNTAHDCTCRAGRIAARRQEARS